MVTIRLIIIYFWQSLSQPYFYLVYYCGSDQGWSTQFWFNTVPSDTDWSPSIAFFGDLGNVNAQSLPRLQEETQRGLYDMILHIGDFAYDMDSVSIIGCYFFFFLTYVLSIIFLLLNQCHYFVTWLEILPCV